MAAIAINGLGAGAQQPFLLATNTFTTLPSRHASHSILSSTSQPTALTTPAKGASPGQDAERCLWKESGSWTSASIFSGWNTVEAIWQSIRSSFTTGMFGTSMFGTKQEELEAGSIPQYVYDYAPYVHLFSGESFWPCDIAEHLVHTTAHLNYSAITGMKHNRTVDDLDKLNRYGFYTYLQSDDNVEERPEWLGGASNIPSHESKETSNGTQPSGYSSAPAILVVIPKDQGIVDAFWFYFYSYNLGNKVLNVRFGNHVGDWEHTLVRFRHGKPEHVFLSEHNAGEAYAYSALEKIGKRPVTFSATGTHAMYATPGSHPYVLPLGLLHDQTDRGPLWDPRQNVYAYTLSPKEGVLHPSTDTPEAPVHWFGYRGHWGDREYPMSDKRQYKFAGQYHYVSGPLGPIYKNLWRKEVCQSWRGPCHIRYWLPPADETKVWRADDGDVEPGFDLGQG